MTGLSWRAYVPRQAMCLYAHIRLPREPSVLRRSQVIRLYWSATNGTGGVYRLDEEDALARASDRDGWGWPMLGQRHAKVTAFGPRRSEQDISPDITDNVGNKGTHDHRFARLTIRDPDVAQIARFRRHRRAHSRARHRREHRRFFPSSTACCSTRCPIRIPDSWWLFMERPRDSTRAHLPI